MSARPAAPGDAREGDNRLSPEDRYQRDPLYHQLVDVIYGCIHRMDLTPTEVREAAMLACMKYELMNARPARLIVDGQTLELRRY